MTYTNEQIAQALEWERLCKERDEARKALLLAEMALVSTHRHHKIQMRECPTCRKEMPFDD